MHRELKQRFVQFSRNGRWGTCSGCPYDGNGIVMPELCTFTDRYDHNLDLDALVFQFKHYEKLDKENNVLYLLLK